VHVQADNILADLTSRGPERGAERIKHIYISGPASGQRALPQHPYRSPEAARRRSRGTNERDLRGPCLIMQPPVTVSPIWFLAVTAGTLIAGVSLLPARSRRPPEMSRAMECPVDGEDSTFLGEDAAVMAGCARQ
jgi:hypothetical protein